MSNQLFKNDIQRKELFIDDDFIEKMKGIKRVFNKPEKCVNNPVIPVDKPWEYGAAFIDAGMVLFDEKEKIFKAWYQGGRCLGPGDNSTMCYATSIDGMHWEKPVLNLIDFKGSKKNNILLYEDIMMHDPAVILDHKESDPSKRYKVIWWGGRKENNNIKLGHCIAFSSDGINWKVHEENPIWCSDSEVVNLLNTEHNGDKYIAYCSIDGYGMRVVGKTESEDFVNWELPPKLIFKSDEQDEPGTEISGLTAVEYFGNYIGMLWVIRRYPVPTRENWNEIVEEGRRNGAFAPQIALNSGRAGRWTVHSELVFSRDNKKWQRINRAPFIPLGDEGSWDECLNLIARPLIYNNKMMFYYIGQGREENLQGDKPKPIKNWAMPTGLATMRIDGFTSLIAGAQEGTLLTEKFKLEGKRIVINCDVRKNGYIKMEILDENGKNILGYTKNECLPILDDSIDYAMSWNNISDLNILNQKNIKLRLFLKNTDLYSITFI